jgi:large subunit ribosomal protein L29
MKSKDIKELRTKTVEELQTQVRQAKEKLATLQMERAQQKLKNLKEVFNLRKDIARMLTFLREKELAAK